MNRFLGDGGNDRLLRCCGASGRYSGAGRRGLNCRSRSGLPESCWLADSRESDPLYAVGWRGRTYASLVVDQVGLDEISALSGASFFCDMAFL